MHFFHNFISGKMSQAPFTGRVLLGICLLALIGSRPASTAPASGSATPSSAVGLKAACFIMGANRNYSDERPAHRVCLSSFVLDRHEVTVAAYDRCMKAGRCKAPVVYDVGHPTRRRCNGGRTGRGNHPINCVTWQQARQYCAFNGGRLPSSAEWELAARRRFAGGRRRDTARCDVAVLARPGASLELGCGAGGTRAVGTSPGDRSKAGVEDLTGNVSEWTADWFALGYYRRSPAKDPHGPRRGRARAVRGCSYQCVPGSRLLTPTARQFSATWDPTIGFRCARSKP